MSRMIKPRHVAAWGAVAAVALALSSGAASAENLIKWKHGVIEPKADAGFFMMAEKRGFYKKYGLDVTMVKIKNDQIGLKAALAGELDSYEGGPGGAIVADSRGVDVRVIGCLWLVVPHGIMVHDDITSMKQLEGNTIAISAPGSFPDILARAALAKYNVPVDKVKMATVGGDLDRYKALVGHVVQAAVVSGEYLPLAKKEHMHMLVTGAEAMPKFVRSCYMSTEKTVKDRPDAAARFMAATIDSLHYAAAHKTEEIKVTQEETGIKPSDPRPEFIYDMAMQQHAIGEDMPLPKDKIDWLQNLLKDLGKIQKTTDVDKLIDPGPREAGMKLYEQQAKK